MARRGRGEKRIPFRHSAKRRPETRCSALAARRCVRAPHFQELPLLRCQSFAEGRDPRVLGVGASGGGEGWVRVWAGPRPPPPRIRSAPYERPLASCLARRVPRPFQPRGCTPAGWCVVCVYKSQIFNGFGRLGASAKVTREKGGQGVYIFYSLLHPTEAVFLGGPRGRGGAAARARSRPEQGGQIRIHAVLRRRSAWPRGRRAAAAVRRRGARQCRRAATQRAARAFGKCLTRAKRRFDGGVGSLQPCAYFFRRSRQNTQRS